MVVGGAFYLDPLEVFEVAHVVCPEDFLDPALGGVWKILTQLAQHGKDVTTLTYIVAATQTGQINNVDEVEITLLFGDAYLHGTKASVLAHAGIVAKQGRKMREHEQLQAEVTERQRQPREGWWSRYQRVDENK